LDTTAGELYFSEGMTPVNARERFVHGRSDGMTLVETIMALFIFSICIGGICSLMIMSRESSDRARSHYTAVSIAKNRLERMRVAQFSEVGLFAESAVVVNYAGVAMPNGDYQRTTTISNVSSTLKQVTVTVEIRNRVTRAFDGIGETLNTYLADFYTTP
jgi:Tfp pilus assembly protein PilV